MAGGVADAASAAVLVAVDGSGWVGVAMIRASVVGLALLVVTAGNTVYLPIVSRSVPPVVPTALPTATVTATLVPATITPVPPTATSTDTPVPSTATATFVPPTATSTATVAAGVCECSGDRYNCGDFNDSHAAAQACFDYCYPIAGDIHKLDQDGDLIACESLLPLIFEVWKPS